MVPDGLLGLSERTAWSWESHRVWIRRYFFGIPIFPGPKMAFLYDEGPVKTHIGPIVIRGRVGESPIHGIYGERFHGIPQGGPVIRPGFVEDGRGHCYGGCPVSVEGFKLFGRSVLLRK